MKQNHGYFHCENNLEKFTWVSLKSYTEFPNREALKSEAKSVLRMPRLFVEDNLHLLVYFVR